MPDESPAVAADAASRTVRRSRVRFAVAVSSAVALMVIPALLLAPMTDPAPVFMTFGAASGFLLAALPHACVARWPRQVRGPNRELLTARTWTGDRTVDFSALRQVRTWQEVGRGVSQTYLIVTDASGVRLGFKDPGDQRRVRQAVERARRTPGAPQPRVSRLAMADLGIRPLPRPLSALRSLFALERSVLLVMGPMMLSALLAGR